VALSLSLALASSSVFAANTVAKIDSFGGKVLVNQGKGFVALSGSLTLKAGDEVLVGEKSFATVSYADCAVDLKSPKIFTVAGKAPCAKGQKLNVDGTFISPVADSDPAMATGLAPALLPLLFIGGTAATVGVLVLTGAFNNNSAPAVSAP
jgi:hypothetical protein